MSDPHELDLEFEPLAPPDWRARVVAACDAAGVPVVFAAVALLAATGLVAFAATRFAPSAETRAAVESALPFTRPAEAVPPPSVPVDDVTVHVAGSVMVPGVYALEPGSRVVDALTAAGGPTATADLARLNLAAAVDDGEQIYVVAFGEDAPAVSSGRAAEGDPDAPINLNSATAERLDELPGVGPATANAIISYREEHGPFVAVDQLVAVPGIGEAKLAAIRDLVTV